MSEATLDLLGHRSADFSPCRNWRYCLRRTWEPDKPWVLFVCLNPSTADESEDDPTIRRCIGFAREWGYGGMAIGNVYAWRSTDPRGLQDTPDPVGAENDIWLGRLARTTHLIVCAWGTHADRSRAQRVAAILSGDLTLEGDPEPRRVLNALAVNANGSPGHPLYLRSTLQPEPWTRWRD